MSGSDVMEQNRKLAEKNKELRKKYEELSIQYESLIYKISFIESDIRELVSQAVKVKRETK